MVFCWHFYQRFYIPSSFTDDTPPVKLIGEKLTVYMADCSYGEFSHSHFFSEFSLESSKILVDSFKAWLLTADNPEMEMP